MAHPAASTSVAPSRHGRSRASVARRRTETLQGRYVPGEVRVGSAIVANSEQAMLLMVMAESARRPIPTDMLEIFDGELRAAEEEYARNDSGHFRAMLRTLRETMDV